MTLEELRDAARAGRSVYCVPGNTLGGGITLHEITAGEVMYLENDLMMRRGFWLGGPYLHARLADYRLTKLDALELRVERLNLAAEAAQKAWYEADNRRELATVEYERELARERAGLEGK